MIVYFGVNVCAFYGKSFCRGYSDSREYFNSYSLNEYCSMAERNIRTVLEYTFYENQ